eukprot:TRINITY_DN4319_c0_g1_i1.p1 TRINITY_DN4319_c0_g1~~TRINITY_DN4319_c0_g1_i1.p1  ORF type:complete len:445 (+),score=143.03 TRINITY_DN4319_c0_g1_i1:286-1620(+)
MSANSPSEVKKAAEASKAAANDAKAKPPRPVAPEEEEEEDEEESLEYHADTVVTVMQPVSLTMILVVAAVRTITLPAQNSVSVIMVYNESASDSDGMRLGGALLNALIFLAAILVTTVAFVLLYKYRCMKILYGWLILSSMFMLAIFGGLFLYLLLEALNTPLDWMTFVIIVWNFAVVGIVTIFWHGPTKVNQGYLILISGLLAIFFTRMPEWTTFAILAVVAIYDLFAVLCPRGPLRLLVEEAQRRQEPIPALLYNASVFTMMADTDPEDPPLARPSGAEAQAVRVKKPRARDAGAARGTMADMSRGDASSTGSVARSASESTIGPSPRREAFVERPPAQMAVQSDSPNPDAPKRKGVKLGLGDFVFYSVLIGRAALFDMSTVFTCFIAIITGLFFTLLLLAIFRKALPALPISIALGIAFYFLTSIFLLPFVIEIGSHGIFV